jgi:hypothetical protein
MPSNTTLDSQQLGRWSTGRLKADHSCGSSSKTSLSAGSTRATGLSASGAPEPGSGFSVGLAASMGLELNGNAFACLDMNQDARSELR